MKDRNENREGPFECVEPELGDRRGLLADPDLDPRLRGDLEDHLTICDACRLDRAVADRADAELRAGRLVIGGERTAPKRRAPRILAWAGGLAAAASVALVFLLPPTPAGPDPLRRSDGESPRFLRPVEGEVLVSDTPQLSWTPVAGATAYRVSLSLPAGQEVWTTRVESTSVRIPEEIMLDGPETYRAVVEPIPADLGGWADVNVTFRRDGMGAFMAYRLEAVPSGTLWLGLAGLLVFGIGALGLWRELRSPHR